MEPRFTGAALHERHDVLIPAPVSQSDSRRGDDQMEAQIVGRLKPGIDRKQALAKLDSVGREIEKSLGQRISPRDAFFLRDGYQGIASQQQQLGKPVLLLLALVGTVLLVASANLAALLLVRSVKQVKETGLRVALGATRWALLRQSLALGLLLASLGGVLGWLISRLFVQELLAFLGRQSGDLAAPGKRIFGYQALIAGQIALSLVLVFGAGLFGRTLRNLRALDLGFRPDNVAMLHVDLSQTPYAEHGAAQYLEQVLERARALPGARAASLTSITVLSGSMASTRLHLPGYVPPNGKAPVTYYANVSGGYFATLGIPLLAGRDFNANDGGGAAIVNQEFARQFLSGEALGKTVSFSSNRTVRIVGLAGTGKFRWLREDPQPILYLPVTQGPFPKSLFVQARTAGNPRLLIESLRGVVQNLDARVPVGQVSTLEMQIDEALARERLLAFLSTLLSSLALALAAIGLYGVLSHSASRRTREIGIRMALGAKRKSVLALLLRESVWTALAGLAAGIPLALACGRLASSLLYGLKAQDPGTAVGAAAILIVTCLAAALIPAWRATRSDPLAALRHE